MAKTMPAGSAPPEEVQAGNVDEKILGKFNSQDELAEGYTQLEGLLNKQGGEVGELRKQNAELMSNQQAAPNTAEEDAGTPSFADREKEILNKIDSGDLELAEGLAQIIEVTREATEDNMSAKFAEHDTKREAQDQYDDFVGDNPLFQQLREAGKLAEVIKLDPMHDEFSAYWALKAEIDVKSAYEKGQEEALRISKGADGTKTILSGPGSQSREAPAPKKGMNSGEQAGGMMAALQASRAN